MNTLLKSARRSLFSVVLLGTVIFLSAGSLNYWQGRMFLGIFFIYVFAFLFLPQKFLERRMQKEKEKEQKLVAMSFGSLFILNFVIYGLNYRFNWQYVPINVTILGATMIFLGYFVMFISLKQNEYAANNITIENGQKVFSNGLYAFVRHPMYLGNIITLVFMPLALGFYWSFIVSLLLIVLLILRIKNEEKILLFQLSGYKEYCNKVKWRLFPYLW
jgi:protein-S-isoprenylcysteine O-methyltransferase Ste14